MTSLAESSPFPWYALKVKTRSEPTAVFALQTRGYDPLYPTYSERRRYCDRTKVVEKALFPGYLFCRFDIQKRLPVISSHAVEYVVSMGGAPVPIPDDQIASVRQAAEAGARPAPHLQTGQRVRVQSGPLAGVEGVLLREAKNGVLVISVEVLQSSISVNIDAGDVCPA